MIGSMVALEAIPLRDCAHLQGLRLKGLLGADRYSGDLGDCTLYEVRGRLLLLMRESMPVLFFLRTIDLVWIERTRLNNNFLLFQRPLRNVIGVVIYHKLLSIICRRVKLLILYWGSQIQ